MSSVPQRDCLDIEVGIEREGLRVIGDGALAQTPHPPVYGDKLDNPYITVDYAEQQIELISTPALGVRDAYDKILSLARIVQIQCKEDGELLWPSSVPPTGVAEDDIVIARYRDDEAGRRAHAYRVGLAQRYGKLKQLYCGIHYNVSCNEGDDERYLRVVRNFLRYGWFLIYLWGCAPDPDQPFSISVRQGEAGYHNPCEIYPDYTSIASYCASIESAIADGKIAEPKEYYAPIRIKPRDPEHSLASLTADGIRYLEIRVMDVDPFDEAGISREALAFLEKFVSFLSRTPCEGLSEQAQREGDSNRRLVADRGLDPDLMLRIDGVEVALRDEVQRMYEALGLDTDTQPRAIKVHEAIAEHGFSGAMLALAHQHQQTASANRWLLTGFEDWELSTQILIKEAKKRGLFVEPLDEADNLIRITRDWHDAPKRVEHVMQATRTGADRYITPLLMNNKTVSKRILNEAGIPTPQGGELTQETFEAVIERWVGLPCVIKPRSTNFGVGVTMFPDGATQTELAEAARAALTHDEIALIETYLPGTEYRFLVIDGQVLAVLNRMPANVVGDGQATITQLVATKNTHPFRAKGYTMPLCEIKIDEAVREYIGRKGYTPESVPAAGEMVFLRPNSNISTGGDSIDVTDQTHPALKQLAVDAAAAFGAVFCGVDIITCDLTDHDAPHGVIEVNWNPAIHVHCFPESGTERAIAPAVLKAIGLIDAVDFSARE